MAYGVVSIAAYLLFVTWVVGSVSSQKAMENHLNYLAVMASIWQQH